ncbi:MAG TPA: hypothetical protein VF054_01395 [Micromonosporaceae bacterium]
MNRRITMLARFAALSLLTGLGLTVGAQPASASYSSLQANLWAYTDSHDAKKSFVKQDGDVPVGTRVDADNEAHTSRFYFTIDITSLRGTAVHAARLYAREKTVADCKATSTTELWRTTEITDQTSWAKPPTELERLATSGTFHAWQCPSAVSFDVLPAVNAALARHDPKITFEMRLASSDEPDVTKARTFANRPFLAVSTNIPSTVSDPVTMGSNGTCGKINDPTPARSSVGLSAKVADADHSSYLSGQFAVWPAEHPDQRTVVSAGGYGADGIGNWNVDLSKYADGTLLAWAARSYDQQDYSDWTKPCYLLVDRTAPKHAPSVASDTYVNSTQIQSGGQGVPGEFMFDAGGDRDVVGFRYEFTFDYSVRYVDATHPGGTAKITYAPKIAANTTLTVEAVDAAGNVGPATRYTFYVAWTAPGVDVDLGGVGLPSKITMYTNLADADHFTYQIEDGKEVKFPVVDGTGSTDLTFTHRGYTSIQARTYDQSNNLLGATTYSVLVSDAPKVSSDDFTWDKLTVLGDQGTFTFQPMTTNVVAYQYRFDWGDWQRVDARSDGTAVLNWTANRAGFLYMEVESIQADGTESYVTPYQFEVVDPHPRVWADLQSWPRRDGVGLPVTVEFSSEMPNVTGFAYTLNGGSEQIVSKGAYAWVEVVPDRPGDNTIVAQAIYADGTRSPSTTYTFRITDAPIVSWNGDTMMPGDTATFTVRPALTEVTSYKYAFESAWPGNATNVATANSDGTLSLQWVLSSPGYHELEIASVSADGTTSDFRIFQFWVSDPTVSVYGYYNDWTPRGGIGVPGWMSFSSGMADQVVQFEYQVNGGPVLTVAMPPNTNSASTTITPDRNGANTLTVRALMTDGRYSPTTTYTFLVGTAPYVQSMDYPNNAWSGGVGVAGTFVFSGGTAGIVAFDYQINGTSAEVTADASGTASIQWTPTASGYYPMYVRGKLADGTLTDQTQYNIYVQY